jgi:hypothetical protein
MGIINFSAIPYEQKSMENQFLTKSQSVTVTYLGINYNVTYRKDSQIKKIWIERVTSSNPSIKATVLENKVVEIENLPKDLEQRATLPSLIMSKIMATENKIVLGLTDLGDIDQYGKYKMLTKNNIDEFSDSLETENYQSWTEFEQWHIGSVDWKDIIEPRLRFIQNDPQGKIHFNLTGMNKNDIEKSLKFDYKVATGETEREWGAKSVAPTGSWKASFGLFGLTYWELMQIVHNRKLLDKTDFYIYDSERSAQTIKLSPSILKLDYGLDLETIHKDHIIK